MYYRGNARSSMTSISFIGLFFIIFHRRRLSVRERYSSAVQMQIRDLPSDSLVSSPGNSDIVKE